MARKKKYLVDEPLPEEAVDEAETQIPQTLVRCPDCPWKRGLIDEKTLCSKCTGSGMILAAALE